jgi:peptide/nickel transport system substrate-binding protein
MKNTRLVPAVLRRTNRRHASPLASALLLAGALILGTANIAAAQDDTSITVVGPIEPNLLDVCETSNQAPGRITRQSVYETLVEVSAEDGHVMPRLATSWSQIDDKTWRFNLVQNAKFHNGMPFNAEAVAFNLKRAAANPECAMYGRAFGGLVVTVTPIDDFTVDISTDKPSPILPTNMALMAMTSPDTPMEIVRQSPGTGPYKIAEWTAGKVVLERNEDYWGEKPVITKVTTVFRGEDSVRAAMVATGEADIAIDVSPEDADNPATDFTYLNSETTFVRMDSNIEPFTDVRVRQAANYAIDRDSMLGTVVQEGSIKATQLPVAGILGHNDALVPYPYDPEKARQLIAEAKADGVNVDAPIRFIVRAGNFAQVDEFAQAITFMLQDVGLNVNLEIMERSRASLFQGKPFPQDLTANLQLIMSDNNLGDASFSVFPHYDSQGVQSKLNDPELDAAITAAASLTGDERRAAYEEIFRKVQEDIVPAIMMFHMLAITRVGPRLDWTPTIKANSELDFQNMKFK